MLSGAAYQRGTEDAFFVDWGGVVNLGGGGDEDGEEGVHLGCCVWVWVWVWVSEDWRVVRVGGFLLRRYGQPL